MRNPEGPWRIWVDTGGTFTDAIAIAPDGTVRRTKILSTSALRGSLLRRLGPARFKIREGWAAPPAVLVGLRFRLLAAEHADGPRVERYDARRGTLVLDAPLPGAPELPAPFELAADEESPIFAARLLTGTPLPCTLPALELRLATTLGTNALLERRGAPTALFVTQGFGDLLEIGTQQRPDLFALEVVKPRPLTAAVVEVDERLAADGTVLRALDLEALESPAQTLLARGVRSAAVALAHSYLNAEHERRLAERLAEWGFEHVSCSAELSPRIQLLRRAETAVVDAYLAPLFGGYLERVRRGAGTDAVLVLTSAGGLLRPDTFRPKDALLSGPAGGVLGSVGAGREAGVGPLIGFDMGGTSTDVSRYDADYEYGFTHRVGDVALAAPALAIETVAAGGGSICWLDPERARVGPESAGAVPGPACYGAGGPLTLTDVNLLLGRLDPERFQVPIDPRPARVRAEELRDALAQRTGERPTTETLLAGFLAIANEAMAETIRRVSVRRGYDPAEHTLVAFGGAGGQHACAVASVLGMTRVLVPADGALLSAWGVGRAVLERFAERQLLEPLERVERRLAQLFEELAAGATRTLLAAGVAPAAVRARRRLLHLRFAGQESTLAIEWAPGLSPRQAFLARHEELFGHRAEERSIELESIQVFVSAEPRPVARAAPRAAAGAAPRRLRSWFAGEWREVEAHDRATLPPGALLDGPALVLEPASATVIEPGFQGRVDPTGALLIESHAAPALPAGSPHPEAVRLELFARRFAGVVEEMGERLERTAVSTNVKERLDFSCALLDRQGRLVANAPHIPVHLGALGTCVRRVREVLELRPGDVVVTNHPAFGGTHLPDVTVVTPIFLGSGASARLLGHAASRAHHAEIGGRTPGSMPADATCLAEEGVVIPPLHLVREGLPQSAAIRALLLAPPWPTRAVEDNLADLRAAVAANHAGAESLLRLARAHGEPELLAYMERVAGLAADSIGDAIEAFPDGVYSATETLDDATPLAVRIEIAGRRAQLDFHGTGGVHPGNLNAPRAIVQSALLYVLRLLVDRPLPLNEGLLRAISIDVPRGLLDPEFPDDPHAAPAVGGGNVETSQRLVDTLLRALGLVACSQGTMNSVAFGNERFGYYETLGGGTGAGPAFPGASAVHSHMTNTRITDLELLEQRHPVRVERFLIRRGSGGDGARRGGDGLIREYVFLAPVSVSLLTQHRVVAPYGLAGGRPGACGRQRVVRRSGEIMPLRPLASIDLDAGDRLVIETPGGGGWGPAVHPIQ